MNWMNELFGDQPGTVDETAAGIARMIDADKARIKNARADDMVRAQLLAAQVAANRCPKCCGAGSLPQFAHRKAGECFTCGGTGVFSRYAA